MRRRHRSISKRSGPRRLREIEAFAPRCCQARAQTLIDEAKESEAAILREAEAAKARMQIEAAEHLARASAQAESLIVTAREEEAALRSEIDRLGQSRLQLVDDIRAALTTYQQWLATVHTNQQKEKNNHHRNNPLTRPSRKKRKTQVTTRIDRGKNTSPPDNALKTFFLTTNPHPIISPTPFNKTRNA
jgi:hypothetical protein